MFPLGYRGSRPLGRVVHSSKVNVHSEGVVGPFSVSARGPSCPSVLRQESPTGTTKGDTTEVSGSGKGQRTLEKSSPSSTDSSVSESLVSLPVSFVIGPGPRLSPGLSVRLFDVEWVQSSVPGPTCPRSVRPCVRHGGPYSGSSRPRWWQGNGVTYEGLLRRLFVCSVLILRLSSSLPLPGPLSPAGRRFSVELVPKDPDSVSGLHVPVTSSSSRPPCP